MQEKNSHNAIFFLVERLKAYFQVDTDYALAEKLGVKANTISTWKNRDTIDYPLILAKCDNVNLNWLLSGEGEMLRYDLLKVGEIDQDLLTVRKEELPPGPCQQCSYKEAIIAAQQETIHALQEALVAYKARDDKESDGQKRKKAG